MTTGDFAAAAPIDEQMEDRERRRLLYVATARACDHLVVSLHRGLDSPTQTSARLLATTGEATLGAQAWTPPDTPPQLPAVKQAVPATAPEYTAWLQELTRVRLASAHPSTQSPSGLEGYEPTAASPTTPPGAAPRAR